MTIIENIALKRRIEVSMTGINIASYTAAAIFMPYILSTIILVSLSAYIIINKLTRQRIFISSGSSILKLFLAYVIIIPIIYKNWIGIVTGAGVVLAIVLGLYLRSIMTRDLFERMMTLICAFSMTSAAYAIIEKVIKVMDSGRSVQRISAVFFHPNYFGTIVGTVIIICAYKVLSRQSHQWFYYMVAMINVISIYLCKSMFVWVEVFIGIAVLLVVFKRHRLLSIWLLAATLGGFFVFFLDVHIIPRLYDVEVTVRLRRQIWELAIDQIRKSPLIGHGFYSFIYLFKKSYHNQIIPHAHSIYLDMLLNFGLIGSGLFLCYIGKFYKKVINICFKEKNAMITSLILAVTAAALVHGTTDITFLWVQTLPLLLVIFSGMGAFDDHEIYSKDVSLLLK